MRRRLPNTWIFLFLLAGLAYALHAASGGIGDPNIAMDKRRGGLPPQPPVMDQGYRVTSFATLGGFNYRSPRLTSRPRKRATADEGPYTSKIPESVMALNGQKVSLQGYMMPIDMDDGGVRSLVIVPHLASCCFGGSPKMNMWVYVTTHAHTKNELSFHNMGSPVRAYGIFAVGEKNSEEVGISLYRLKADKLIEPDDPS